MRGECRRSESHALFATHQTGTRKKASWRARTASVGSRSAHRRSDGFQSHALRLCVSRLPARCAYQPARASTTIPSPRASSPLARRSAPTTAPTASPSTPEQIVLTTSTSEAYSFLFRLLCDPGDEILIPQPSYPLFDFLAALDDVRLKAAPLVYENGWQIDPDGIRRAITPQTRAIVVVHPNNPTGHFTKPWEAEELARLCREFHLSLIVDEVFLDYSFGAEGQSFAAGLEDVPVYVVSGLSKIAGLPQMKAAWIVVTGPERDRALARLEVIADTFLSMNAPVQWAMPAWLEGRAAIQEQIRQRVATNLAVLDRALQAVKAVQRLEVEGGWYAILRIPALEPDEQTVLALARARRLGSSRLLFRDGGVGLAGRKPARRRSRNSVAESPS